MLLCPSLNRAFYYLNLTYLTNIEPMVTLHSENFLLHLNPSNIDI